jgi:nuclear pore complex protein Nup210
VSKCCVYRSLDHHDIISLKPEYNDSSKCSTSARLTSIAPYSGRKETSVYATDIISGVTIHCKVFVDRISRIRIFHHSVKIDLDEVATLRVHAFDDEGYSSVNPSCICREQTHVSLL